MHLVRRMRQMPRLTSVNGCMVCISKNYTSSTTEKEEIEIPNRIHRSPTDILYALSRTVGQDPTAAHYKYYDDPYLIPMTNVGKRTFAAANEAGRKAARWIREQHRDMFLHQEAQPAIKEFAPKLLYTEESEVDENALQQLIMQSQVEDAVLVYNLMKQKGIEISNELRQSFLELLCFYNHEEPLPDEYIEERWFKDNQAIREKSRKTWKDGDLAETVFAEIEPKTPASYGAIIRGMSKYYQVERAYALLQEATEKQFALDTRTYNAVISVVSYLKETADQRWQLCQDLLQQMAERELMPDVGTLNALLECISTFGNFKLARSCCMKALGEIRKLGVQPSLGTYYYMLIIYCRDRAPVSHILVDILHEIKDKEFNIVHPKDTFFFTTAMDVCRNHLSDNSLAKKLDAVLHTGNNYDLIGDSYKESVYYRHYFGLLCQTETMDDFMQEYDLLVPNIYIPEPGIMEELLKTVEANAGIEHVPRLWSDMLIFDLTSRESLLVRMLRIMIANKPNVDIPTQAKLPEQFAKVALDIYNKIADPEARNKKLSFTGEMIGNILTLLVRGQNFDKAAEVFTTIDKDQHLIPGTPSESCLLEFIECCIANKAPSQAISCVEYAAENHMDSVPLAQRIHAGFTLNEVHLSKLKSLAGDAFAAK